MISKSRMRYDRTIEYYQDRVPCTGCFSSGRITCTACNGTGKVLPSSTISLPPGSSSQPVLSGKISDAWNEFTFSVQNFVHHPVHNEIYAVWQRNPGNCLDIGENLRPIVRVELAGVPLDTWLPIRDNSGRPVPLMIRMDSSGQLIGKWV
jgi:hypothetical protein